MNEVQVIKEPIDLLPESQRNFVILRTGHMSVKAISVNTVKIALTDILTNAYFDMGLKEGANAQTLQFQVEACYRELKGELADLTIPEIREAFRLGVRGEAGQFIGMCPQTYNKFLKWFHKLPERQKSWVDYLDMIDKTGPRSEKPKELTKENLKEAALRAFEDYKKSGKLPFVPHAIYDTIKELTGAETLIDRLDWDKIKTEAKLSYSEQTRKASSKPRSVQKQMAEVGTLLKLDYSLNNRSFEFHVKKIGLKYYFDTLISKGGDLKL